MTKRLIFIPVVLFFVMVLFLAGVIFHTKGTIRESFRLNQLRKSEGYYLAEFEWNMLACVKYLDTGQYVRALTVMHAIHDSLSDPKLLARAPASPEPLERLRFYQSMQNPRTGAFIRDDSLPLFTYIGPTANMITLIEELSAKAKKPFELKYSLSFLDKINTPERLKELLDDASRVGWIGAQFKTPYVCVAELGELAASCERLGIYEFTPEWKKSLFDWFYENQDPDTGLWGPRSRSDDSLLHGGSLTESERVIKMFVDREGNQIHHAYPLRYVDNIIASSLEKLATPMPDDLDELHEWILARDHGTRFITRYLWSFASLESREKAKGLMEDFIQLRFKKYYAEKDGAFSLYPNSETADLDGTGEAIGMFGYLGILDSLKQQRLWGDYETIVENFGRRIIARTSQVSFESVSGYSGVNSIRVYIAPPGTRFLDKVALIYYPRKTVVPDAVQILANVNDWLGKTPQQMGNWVTKDSIRKLLANIAVQSVPTFMYPPVDEVNRILQDNGQVVLVGFDLLQIPLCMIAYQGEGRERERTPNSKPRRDNYTPG
ncbi:hypothetical protein K9F62_12820 [Desulfovibrio sp. JY]|nr:hypothetical protein K9F62_12820 [Desulfovibrio sp. JY]